MNQSIIEQAMLKKFVENSKPKPKQEQKPKAQSISKNSKRYAREYAANKRLLLTSRCGYPL